MYAWQEKSEQEGAVYAEKLPNGKHRVTLSRLIFGNRNGQFVSRSNDPQVMLIFSDEQAREVGQMVTLSDKAGWVLARLMGCFDPPANLARMEADGIEPNHFANEEFAEKQLLDRQLDIEVAWEQQDGKEFATVTPLKPSGTTTAPPSTDAPPRTNDAPPSAGMTKDQAWNAVVEAWNKRSDEPDAAKKRNEAWIKAVKDRNKPETEFDPSDWSKVAEEASLPF